MTIIVSTPVEYLIADPAKVSGIQRSRDDYALFLDQIGHSQPEIEAIMHKAGPVESMPILFNHLSVQPSSIHGLGMHTSVAIKSGDLVCPVLDYGKRTVAARYTNHSPDPNAVFVRTAKDGMVMKALRDIRAGDELTVDYRQVCAVNGSGVLPSELQAKFGQGDAYGQEKRMQAVADATEQLTKLEPGSTREKLYAMQKACADLPDVEMPLQHTFAPGVYVRTIFIPAGCVVIGKIHKHSHANVLSQGRVSVLTESGGLEDLQGPLTMVSEPGTKRAVYAHTDTVWTTIHPTDKTDLAEIEQEVIAKTYEEYEQFAMLKLGEKL